MESEIDFDNLTDDQQERMCDLCEELILECSSNSSTFQCEGCRCEEAFDLLLEDVEDDGDNKVVKLSYRMQLRVK